MCIRDSCSPGRIGALVAADAAGLPVPGDPLAPHWYLRFDGGGPTRLSDGRGGASVVVWERH
eukprot:1971463-Alexandrium_andersonii.AAC.1